MKTPHVLINGAGILTIAALACGAWAAGPSQADIDRCNQKAAEVSARTAKGAPTTAPQPGSPSGNPTGGRITDSSQPGALPGAGTNQPSNNPTGGRITDSTSPGSMSSVPGMASAGETDGVYRQAYAVCMSQRSQ